MGGDREGQTHDQFKPIYSLYEWYKNVKEMFLNYIYNFGDYLKIILLKNYNTPFAQKLDTRADRVV